MVNFDFLYVTEVERQLSSKVATTPQLPNKKQRTGSSSSAKHQHQLSDPQSLEPPPSSSPRGGSAQSSIAGLVDDTQLPMLSTFAGRSSSQQQQQQQTPTSEGLTPGPQGILSTKSTVVQLRRNTNKRGRQAPTPPKRTRYNLTQHPNYWMG
jgi:hypothetical protein